MIKDIAQSFLPWILYFVLSGHSVSQMKIAITVAAIVSIFVERKNLKKRFILSWVTLIFFSYMFLSVVVYNSEWVMKHAWVLSHAALVFVAWFSILIKRPFTLQYAKEMVHHDKWNHPIFLRINYILTMVWGIIFTIGLLANLSRLYYPDINIYLYELLTDGVVVFGIWFNTKFPDWYKKRVSI